MRTVDVAVVGAGPAGMAAAVEARRAGLSVMVFDEQTAPGGQIWRGVESASPALHDILGPDYARGADAVRAFRASGADYRPQTAVWDISAERVLNFAGPHGAGRVTARTVILATGALERPMPVPGWTLPGVTTAGALQILLKTSALAAQRAVLVGNGPLLWLIGCQMVAAGAPPRAVVEISAPGARRAALRRPAGLFARPRQVAKGLGMIRRLRRAKVPIHRTAAALRIDGTETATALVFEGRGGETRIETECIALHNGVFPNQQASRLLSCAHDWDPGQAAFRPCTDAWGETSRPGIFAVGDGAGIAGADAAEFGGRLAARRVAERQGRPVPGDSDVLHGALRRERAFRPFLDALYPPLAQCVTPGDSTILCRCEEVTAGQLREAVAQGAPGPNQAKAFLRCGMGPCQGRICGLPATRLIARARDRNEADIGYYTIRPPLKPLPLGAFLSATGAAAE